MKTFYLLTAAVLCFTACNGSSKGGTEENSTDNAQSENVEVVQGSKILKSISFTEKNGQKGTHEVTYAYDDQSHLSEITNSQHVFTFDYQPDGVVKFNDDDKRYSGLVSYSGTIQPAEKAEDSYRRKATIKPGTFTYQVVISTDLNHYIKSFDSSASNPDLYAWSGKNLTEMISGEEQNHIKMTYGSDKNPTNVNLLIHTNNAVLSELQTDRYATIPKFMDEVFDYIVFSNDEFTHQSEQLATSMSAQEYSAHWDIQIHYTFDEQRTPISATYKVELSDKEHAQPEVHEYDVKYTYAE